MRPTQEASRQRGQALVFTLVFAAVTGLAVLLLFNSGKLANAKTDLQNAADAGAHAAAILQARDHNFSAYTNRAMIANQVAVAQFVSLKSYFDDAAETQDRMKNGTPYGYSLAFPSSKPSWDAAKNYPISAAKTVISTLAPWAVKGLDGLISILEEAQQIHHYATMAEMMFVADEVVKKNDPAAQITKSAFMLGDAVVRVNQWGNNYTKQHPANTSAAEADRFADAVLHDDSQDKFTRNRSGILSAGWAFTTVKFCIGATFSQTAFGFFHGGGTILSSNKKRWLALDATAGFGEWTCTYPTPWGPITIGTPLMEIAGGSGGAVAGKGGAYGESTGYKNNDWTSSFYGFALTSPASIPAIYRYTVKGPGTTLDNDGGLQKYYRDVANPLGSKPSNQTAEQNGGAYPVTVEVERRVDAGLRLSSTLLPDAKDVRLDDAAKGATLRTVASAHAYFYRPKSDGSNEFTRNGWRRGDARTEMANLFSPYWQARLIETPAAESLASALAQN
jgi:hypothetical protein